MPDAVEVQEETPADAVEETPAVEAVAEPEVVEIPLTPEERVEVGSIIERTARGWSARLHYGGAMRLFGEGRTIADALTAAGIV